MENTKNAQTPPAEDDRTEDEYWSKFSRETALRMDYLSGSAFLACALDGASPQRRVLRLKQALGALAVLKAGAPTERTTEIHERMRRCAGHLWDKGEYDLADAVYGMCFDYYGAAMLSVARAISGMPFGPETDPGLRTDPAGLTLYSHFTDIFLPLGPGEPLAMNFGFAYGSVFAKLLEGALKKNPLDHAQDLVDCLEMLVAQVRLGFDDPVGEDAEWQADCCTDALLCHRTPDNTELADILGMLMKHQYGKAARAIEERCRRILRPFCDLPPSGSLS